MNNIFIEKYALLLEPYHQIKATLNLGNEQFEKLKIQLSIEIAEARKVRQLFIRKKISGISVIYFYHWWLKLEKKCCYCGITSAQLHVLFEKLDSMNKRKTRGKTLELDRRVVNKSYKEIENLFLCCYMCNNAKSDFFTHEQFEIIGKAIEKTWKSILQLPLGTA